MTKAAVYCRVSGDEQAKGWSLDGQYRDCREYAQRLGYRVVRAYQEIGSGSNADRPQFQLMVQHGLQGRFDVVVVWKRDRFGRDPVANGFFMRLLGERGVKVEPIDQGPSEDTPHDEFMGYIMDAVARLEARNIAARCHMGRLEMARRGLWPTKPLWGWRRKRGTKELEPDPKVALLVRALFFHVGEGHSARAVAERIGCTYQTVLSRVRNPAYKGRAIYDGVPVPVPRLVLDSEWQKANDMVAAKAAAGNHKPEVLLRLDDEPHPGVARHVAFGAVGRGANQGAPKNRQ